MGLGVALLEQRQPRLLRVLALRKVQRAAVGLVDAAVGLLGVKALALIEEDAVGVALVIVGLCEVELGGV